jgi:hypothetical protein
MKITLLIILILYTFSSLAQSQRLLLIKNDQQKNIDELLAIVDNQGNITGFKFVSKSNPSQKSNLSISLQSLKNGTPILKKSDVVIISMRTVPGFDPRYGGLLEIKYLTSLTRKIYAQKEFHLFKEENTWKAFSGNRQFNTVLVETKKAIGVAIGVEDLHFIN